MNIEELREIQREFLDRKDKDFNRQYLKLEKLRKQFIKKFPTQTLNKLPLNKYVIGRKNKDSFCYWLEIKLKELGRIGGSPADKRFGIYYGETKHESEKKYRFLTIKWGKTKEEAFNNIKNEIINLVKASENNNQESLVKNKLSPIFKGKILSTYFPEKYLNIFSEEHVNYFLEKFGDTLAADKKSNVIDKRKRLLEIKHSDDVMKEWSVYEFSKFLYDKITPPRDEKNLPKNSPRKKTSAEKFPAISQVIPEAISLNSKPVAKTIKNNTNSGKADWREKNRKNKKLGERGELIVMLYEENKFKEKNVKIEHVAKKDEFLGYDIISLEPNEKTRKYIEVKSTTRKVGDAVFFISDNEYQKAKEMDNYYIYIVYEANTTTPKIWEIKKPFALSNEHYKMEPVSYRVRIGTYND